MEYRYSIPSPPWSKFFYVNGLRNNETELFEMRTSPIKPYVLPLPPALSLFLAYPLTFFLFFSFLSFVCSSCCFSKSFLFLFFQTIRSVWWVGRARQAGARRTRARNGGAGHGWPAAAPPWLAARRPWPCSAAGCRRAPGLFSESRCLPWWRKRRRGAAGARRASARGAGGRGRVCRGRCGGRRGAAAPAEAAGGARARAAFAAT